MKLSDIDEMQRTKREYLEVENHIAIVGRLTASAANNGGHMVSVGGASLPGHIVTKPVLAAAATALNAERDKLVAKLMLYGVEDWDVKK